MLLFDGNGVLVWGDGKVLEMNSGDDCTTVQIYFIPLNCILEMVKIVNIMFIFYHNKKYVAM